MISMEESARNCRNCNHCIVYLKDHPSLDRCLRYGTYCDWVIGRKAKMTVGGPCCQPGNLISWTPKPPTLWDKFVKLFN